MQVVLIGIGGILGTFSRYAIQLLIKPAPAGIPWGTIVVNIVGCAIFGFVVRALTSTTDLQVAVLVGFCGAFTTMSTFAFEFVTLVQGGRFATATAYGAVSLVGSLAAMVGGLMLGGTGNR